MFHWRRLWQSGVLSLKVAGPNSCPHCSGIGCPSRPVIRSNFSEQVDLSSHFVSKRLLGEQALGRLRMVEPCTNTADVFEIIRTTRSMRRLKPDPVPNELIRKILEAGVCAPSGGNMQRWRFLVIRDPKIKQTVGALYKRAWDEQVAPRYRSGEPAPSMSRSDFCGCSTRGISGRTHP
jgi:hypothetical protein